MLSSDLTPSEGNCTRSNMLAGGPWKLRYNKEGKGTIFIWIRYWGRGQKFQRRLAMQNQVPLLCSLGELEDTAVLRKQWTWWWGGASMVENISGGCYPWSMVLVENTTMEMSSLILIKINVFWSSRGQVVAFNHQRQGWNEYVLLAFQCTISVVGSKARMTARVLIHRHLWQTPIGYGVSRKDR